MAPLTVILVFLLVAVVGVAYYAIRIEPFRILMPEYETPCPGLPEELDGLRIAHVTDIHIGVTQGNRKAVERAIKAARADLFALTGDYLYGHGGGEEFAHWLPGIGGVPLPALAVTGNGEYKRFAPRELVVEALRGCGIPVLRNDCTLVPVRGGELQVVGVDDPHTGHADVDAAFAAADPDRWTLMLAHSPDALFDMEGKRCDLMLCGHTHGGQVKLPILGAVSRHLRRGRAIYSGWYGPTEIEAVVGFAVGGLRVFISRGMGTARLAIRYNAPPELPIHILRRVA
jgi:predicted MPP superfamily phosphohydrolase